VFEQRIVGQGVGRLVVELFHQLLDALPRDEQRRADDQYDGSAEKQLAFGGEREAKLTDLPEHASDCNHTGVGYRGGAGAPTRERGGLIL